MKMCFLVWSPRSFWPSKKVNITFFLSLFSFEHRDSCTGVRMNPMSCSLQGQLLKFAKRLQDLYIS